MPKRLTVAQLQALLEQQAQQMQALMAQNAELMRRLAPEPEPEAAPVPAPKRRGRPRKEAAPAPAPEPEAAPAPKRRGRPRKEAAPEPAPAAEPEAAPVARERKPRRPPTNYTCDITFWSFKRSDGIPIKATEYGDIKEGERVINGMVLIRIKGPVTVAVKVPRGAITDGEYWIISRAGRVGKRLTKSLSNYLMRSDDYRKINRNLESGIVMIQLANVQEQQNVPAHAHAETVNHDGGLAVEQLAHPLIDFEFTEAASLEDAIIALEVGIENACTPNLILKAYSESFAKNGIPLTIDTIAADIGGYIDDGKPYGMTLAQLRMWCDRWGIKLSVFNVHRNLLPELCIAEARRVTHGNINPRHLAVVHHGSHVYLASGLNTRGYKTRAKELEEAIDLELEEDNSESTRAVTADFVAPKHVDSVFMDNINDLPGHFLEWLKETKNDTYRVAYAGDLNQLVFRLMFKCHYEPQVHCAMGQLMSVRIKSHSKWIIITKPHATPVDRAPTITSQLENDTYGGLVDRWNKVLYAPECISTYSPSLMKFVSELHGAPSSFFRSYAGVFTEVDTCKAYTSFLLKLAHLPVFNITDEFRPYNGEKLEDYAFYHVEVHCMKGALAALFRGRTNVLVGVVVKQLVEYGIIDKSQIKAHIRPYRLVSLQPIHDVVKDLWASALPMDAKKAFVNTAIGSTGRMNNTRVRCSLYRDVSEATHYKGNGDVLPLRADGYDQQLYQVTDKQEAKRLNGGLRVLQSMIYHLQRWEAFQRWQAMESEGYEVLGVKVDAVFVVGDISHKQETIDKSTFESIGKVTYTAEDGVIDRREQSIDMESHTLAVPYPKRVVTHLADEYSDELVSLYGQGKKVLAIGAGGCGKTEGVVRYIHAHPEKRFLVCAPTHELIANVNRRLRRNVNGGEQKVRVLKGTTTWKRVYDASFDVPDNVTVITPHKLTRWMPQDRYSPPIDLSVFDVVVFDEVYSIPTDMLCRAIKMLEGSGPLEVYACGDWHQTQPMDSVETSYRWNMIKSYFGETIVELLQNKRLKVEQRERMDAIMTDIFDNATYTPVVVKSHLKPTGELRGMCLSLTNETRKKVNSKLHAAAVAKAARGHVVAVKGKTYYYTQQLVCKEPVKLEEGDIHRNAVVEIVDFQSGAFKVWNGQSERMMRLPHEALGSFGLSYCRTVHSFQGASIEGDFTIIDWEHWHSDAHWLYTAISRCRDLDGVHYYTGTEFQPTAAEKFEGWVARKVEGYRAQDAKRNMRAGDLTAEWVLQQYHSAAGKCAYCNCHMGCEGDCMMTVDRVNSSLPHDMENCVVACLQCNRAKGDKAVMR